MNKRGSLVTSLYQVIDIIIPAILLILLLTFVYRSVSGEAFKEDYISKDIALMIDSMDKSPYIIAEYTINKDVELKITKNKVKVGRMENHFDSNVNINFNSQITGGATLIFTKEKDNLKVTTNA